MYTIYEYISCTMKGRRDFIKSVGSGVAATSITALVGSASAAYSRVGETWEDSESYSNTGIGKIYYPPTSNGAPAQASINVAAEKIDEETKSSLFGQDLRIHELDIGILFTGSYDLWDDNHAQLIKEVAVGLDGRSGADVQVWEDGDTGTAISGPVREASEINQTAEQIAQSEYEGYDDALVGLATTLIGLKSTVAGGIIGAGSFAHSIAVDGTNQSTDSKTYRWDYTHQGDPRDYLNPQEYEYDRVDQTYAASIYLSGIRVAIPADDNWGVLRLEPELVTFAGIRPRGTKNMTYDIYIGNDPSSGL